jgi:hypothetical protein
VGLHREPCGMLQKLQHCSFSTAPRRYAGGRAVGGDRDRPHGRRGPRTVAARH